MIIKFGVLFKGWLMDKIFDWFVDCGLILCKIGVEWEYFGVVDGIEGVELVLLLVGEILCELIVGCIYFGVIGFDLVCEKIYGWEICVVELVRMGFGGVDLIIVVLNVWVDVEIFDDLDVVVV